MTVAAIVYGIVALFVFVARLAVAIQNRNASPLLSSIVVGLVWPVTLSILVFVLAIVAVSDAVERRR